MREEISNEKYEVIYYMSRYDKYLLTLSNFKNRHYSNLKKSVGGLQRIYYQYRSYSMFRVMCWLVYIEDVKLLLYNYDGDKLTIELGSESTTESILFDYSQDKIIFGDIELLKQ